MQEIMLQMREVSYEDEQWTMGLTDSSVAFLSWLKLSVYMAIVSVAIVLSFHLKSKPSSLGMQLTCPVNELQLTVSREANRTAARCHILDLIAAVLA